MHENMFSVIGVSRQNVDLDKWALLRVNVENDRK